MVWLCGTPCHRVPVSCLVPEATGGGCSPYCLGRGRHPLGSHSAWGVSLWSGAQPNKGTGCQKHRGHWHPHPVFSVLSRSAQHRGPTSSLPQI